MKKILLIEDEANLAKFIMLELRHEGFETVTARDGTEGLRLALAEGWDLILLDLMLPKMDGFRLCKEVMAVRPVPIIMITARDSVSDRVTGLDSGAEDFIPKPFAVEELLARIRVVFRRQQEHGSEKGLVITCGDLTLDIASRQVRNGTLPVVLTKREFALLEAFMKNPNRVLSREMLLDLAWGFDAVVDTNVVDVYVRYLRNKIDTKGMPSLIETVRGIGYAMRK